ncbi:glutamate racemase [Actinomyces sp. zg-332]|uniref:glutamate racemase n=1 Tax=Actinomyces sp. zg-332 TaxID=2708340 RepID=UPI0014226879|nr:glutamate racemase [Actinomyces sp. zg-332]QPK94589.1 glutamate racemase [Actinomyces sp. zg-332]
MEKINNLAPIGIFDSGVGGLTVARAIIDQLPNESIKYIGDSINAPYGEKTIEEVKDLSLTVMDKLVDEGVKMLVIACNSASSAVYDLAKNRYEAKLGIPVIEVIQPATRAALSATRNKKIGVIGTKATIDSKSYLSAFCDNPMYSKDIEIYTKACPDFVKHVEKGVVTGKPLIEIAEKYLNEIKAENVDTLVLGCTHYPLLSGVISYVMGKNVCLVSSAEETAKDVYATLLEKDIANPNYENGKYEFYTTGNEKEFEKLARRFLGPEVSKVKTI